MRSIYDTKKAQRIYDDEYIEVIKKRIEKCALKEMGLWTALDMIRDRYQNYEDYQEYKNFKIDMNIDIKLTEKGGNNE